MLLHVDNISSLKQSTPTECNTMFSPNTCNMDDKNLPCFNKVFNANMAEGISSWGQPFSSDNDPQRFESSNLYNRFYQNYPPDDVILDHEIQASEFIEVKTDTFYQNESQKPAVPGPRVENIMNSRPQGLDAIFINRRFGHIALIDLDTSHLFSDDIPKLLDIEVKDVKKDVSKTNFFGEESLGSISNSDLIGPVDSLSTMSSDEIDKYLNNIVINNTSVMFSPVTSDDSELTEEPFFKEKVQSPPMEIPDVGFNDGYFNPVSNLAKGCLLSFDQVLTPPIPDDSNVLNFMTGEPITTTIPEKAPVSNNTAKRGRGRPRKVQTPYKDIKHNLSFGGTNLPTRKSKEDCKERMRKSISEESNFETPSDQENIPVSRKSSCKRVKNFPKKPREDPDYKMSEFCDFHSLVDGPRFPMTETDILRRKKNNKASKESRDRRALKEKEMDSLCIKLEARHFYLKTNADKLQVAVDKVMECITSVNRC